MFCVVIVLFFFFFNQKTAYEMRISDWSSDVCSSDLEHHEDERQDARHCHALVLVADERARGDLRPGAADALDNAADEDLSQRVRRHRHHHPPAEEGEADEDGELAPDGKIGRAPV